MRRLLFILILLCLCYWILEILINWNVLKIILVVVIGWYLFKLIANFLFYLWWRRRGGGSGRGLFHISFMAKAVYGYLVLRPKYIRMEKYIQARGWKPYKFKDGMETRELWVNPIYKDNGYDESGKFSLYGAYEKSRSESKR